MLKFTLGSGVDGALLSVPFYRCGTVLAFSKSIKPVGLLAFSRCGNKRLRTLATLRQRCPALESRAQIFTTTVAAARTFHSSASL